MRKKLPIIFIAVLLCIATLTLVSCSKNDNSSNSNSSSNGGGNIEESSIYTEEIVDEKYLKEQISEATAIYYKSSKDGKFGDERYLFEVTSLPKEYTEVDYIESNGEQYIDTEIEYNPNLSFELKFSNYTTAANGGGIFGSDGWLFSLTRRESTSLIWVVEELKKFQYNNFSPYKEYTVSCSKDSLIINDNAVSATTETNNFGEGNITIFKTHQGLSSFKLYKFKINDGETVVRNYIPCYRNYDEQVGLFDLVSNTFFTNANSGSFIIDDSDIEYKDLPIEYQQVTYIESTGGQYINTNIIPTSNTKWVIDCEFEKSGSYLMGCLQPTGRFHFGVWQEGYHPGLYDGYDNILNIDTNRHTFILNAANNSFYVDSYRYESESWIIVPTSTTLPTNPIYLFARNDSNVAACYTNEFKLYSTSIYQGDTLIAEYIPCYRIVDKEIGLYETVSNVFYYNEGTGSFKKGTNVTKQEEDFNKIYTQIEYIESTGTQFIDTGVKANALTSFAIEYALSSLNDNENYILGNDMVKVYPSSSSLKVSCAGEEKLVDCLAKDKKLVLSIAQGQIYYQIDNGELTPSESFTTPFISTNNLYLFAINDTAISYANSTKIFACKIYQDTELIRDFIPVIKNRTNEVGLYDLVEEKFYPNLGTGTFNTRYDYSSDKKDIKNLLDIESITKNPNGMHNVKSIFANNETGVLTITASGNSAYTPMCYHIGETADSSYTLIPVIEGLTYRLSFDATSLPASTAYINYYNNDKIVVYKDWEDIHFTKLFDYYYCDITIPKSQEISYVWFRFGYVDSKDNDVISVKNLQFRQGINAYAFIPYEDKTSSSYYSDIASISTTSFPYVEIDNLQNIEQPILNTEKSYSNELAKLFDTTFETISTIPSDLFINQSNNGTISVATNAYGHSKALQFVSNGDSNRCHLSAIPLKANATFTISYDYFSTVSVDMAMRFELNTGDYKWTNSYINYTTPGTWQRLSLTYTPTSDTLLYYFIYGLENTPVYADNLQLVFGTETEYSNGFTKYFEKDSYTFVQETMNDCSCIFFNNTSDSTPNAIYYAKVYDGTNLIYDLKPCHYDLKNRSGLYDNVNKVFYMDNGMGAFINSSYSLLPQDFQQVEYIKANGYQYIDTNYKPNQDTKVEMMVESSGTYAYYYGCWDIAYNNGAYALGNDGHNVYIGYDGQGGGVGSPINSGSHLLIQDKNKVYVDGTLFNEQTYTGFQTNNNLYLFTQNRAGLALQPAGNRTTETSYIYCKYCKIYENDILIRYFIPCYRVIDNVAGMYDLITDFFFANSGSGEFVCGDDVNNGEYSIDISDNFEVLDSIEFDGTRNIDLGVRGDAKYTFDIKFTLNAEHRQLMGYNGNAENYWGVNADGYYESWFVWEAKGSKIKAGNRDVIVDEYSKGNIKRYCNSELAFESTYLSLDDYSYSIGTLLGLKKYTCVFTLYSLKIEQNDKIINDYIPAKRLSDSSIGLFDKITQHFMVIYNNSDGFSHGEEIGHSFDDGKVITQVSEKQDGEIIYTCSICGKEIHKHTDSYSYSVTFKYDEGVDYIKVYKGYDFSSYEKVDIAYTRNANTNNFSRKNGAVYFEIVLKDGYSLNKISTGGTMCTSIENNIYKASYISANTIYGISTTKEE